MVEQYCRPTGWKANVEWLYQPFNHTLEPHESLSGCQHCTPSLDRCIYGQEFAQALRMLRKR